MDGGAAYEAYVLSFRKEVELADKCRQLTSLITTLDQCVTIFTLTTTIAGTPAYATHLGQLQQTISDKKEELKAMVISKSAQCSYLH